MNNLSICILALNEERNIKALFESVKGLSDDIVVVIDDQTTDRTADVAKTYTDNVIIHAHEDNFHLNKQYTLLQAKYDWVLWMDGDEMIEPSLANEITTILEKPQYPAYKIPRKNMMFGKWIEHAGWYPDYQIRLFQKSKTHFPCQRVHEDPEVKGEISTLQNHIVHQNYQSIAHFIEKLNKYTTNDALHQTGKQKYSDKELFTKPMDEFCKRFMMWDGYKDGSIGLMLSQLQAFYELTTMIKVRELDHFNSVKNVVSPDKANDWIKQAYKIWVWWYWENKICNSDNALHKVAMKIKRKIIVSTI